jgi:hypothetical protein
MTYLEFREARPRTTKRSLHNGTNLVNILHRREQSAESPPESSGDSARFAPRHYMGTYNNSSSAINEA